MGLIGVLLIFKDSLPLTFNCVMSTIHGLFAVISWPGDCPRVPGHPGPPGTWRALIDGKVGRLWAKKHHSEWYKDITAKEPPGKPAEKPKGAE